MRRVAFSLFVLLAAGAARPDETLRQAAYEGATVPGPLARNDPGPKVKAAEVSRNPLGRLKLEDLSATRERPLFSPSRRPPPPPPAAPPPPPPPPAVVEKAAGPEPPPFELVGAVVGFDASFVLLRNRADNSVKRFRPGEDVGGWRVGAISLRSVVLERDRQMETLALAGSKDAPVGVPQIAERPDADEAPVAVARPAFGKRTFRPDH